MSESDSLRMAAEITDRFSKPLKDLQRSLRSLAAESGGFHKQGIVQSKSHTEALLQLRREVSSVAERVKTGLAPAMSALGISSIGAAAAVAAVTKSLVDFAGNARHLEFMSKQTQLTVNQLRAWEQEASRLGTSSESLTGSFVEFNAAMEKMARTGRTFGKEFGIAQELRELQSVLKLQFPRAELDGLVRSLQGLGREAQVEKIIKFGERIRDISKRKEFYQAFHLDPNLANKGSAEILKDLDEIEKRLGKLTEAQLKAGTDFQESIERIKDSLTGLRDAIGADLAPTMSKVAESIAKFADAHADDIAKGLGEFAKRMRELGDSELLKSLRGFASGLDTVVEATTGWAPILGAIAAYKVAQFTGLAAALRAIAGGMAAIAAVPPPAWLMPLLAAMAAAKGAQEFVKDPGGAVGLTGPNSMGAHLRELYGMATGAKPDIQDERIMPPPGTGPGGAKPQEPLWKRLFNLGANEAPGGIMPAGFQVSQDWVGALKSGGGGGGGDPRTAEGIIERGTLAALRDFAAEQKGADGGGGGGGGAGGGMSAIRAAYSPGGAAGGTGEPSADGGAGGRPSRAPIGALPRLNELPGAPETPSDGPGKPPGQNVEGPAGTPSRGDPRGLSDFIRSNAKKYGLSGDAMVKAWGSEGLGASFGASAKRENSWGATQLHYPGLANEFEKDTGLKANDPKNERAMIDWSHAYIAKHPNAFDRGGGGKWFGPGNRYGAQSAHAMAQRVAPSTSVGQMTGDVMGDPRRTGGAFNDPSRTRIHGPQTTVTLNNGQKVTVNSRVAEQYKGFFNDLSAAGAPVHSLGGFGYRGGNPSQHPGGMAVDWAQSGRNRVSPDVQRWISQNPAVLNQLETKWGMSGGEHWRNPDTGHFSIQNIWGEEHLAALAHPATRDALAKTRSMPNIGAAIGGTATQEQNSWQRLHGALGRANQITPLGIKEGDRLPGGKGMFDQLKAEQQMMEFKGQKDPDTRIPKGRELHADLLSHARQAGLVGQPMQHKVTGSATLDVNFNGAPQGTTHRLKADGMFTKIALNRGRAMPPAHQDG